MTIFQKGFSEIFSQVKILDKIWTMELTVGMWKLLYNDAATNKLNKWIFHSLGNVLGPIAYWEIRYLQRDAEKALNLHLGSLRLRKIDPIWNFERYRFIVKSFKIDQKSVHVKVSRGRNWSNRHGFSLRPFICFSPEEIIVMLDTATQGFYKSFGSFLSPQLGRNTFANVGTLSISTIFFAKHHHWLMLTWQSSNIGREGVQELNHNIYSAWTHFVRSTDCLQTKRSISNVFIQI